MYTSSKAIAFYERGIAAFYDDESEHVTGNEPKPFLAGYRFAESQFTSSNKLAKDLARIYASVAEVRKPE